MINRATTKITIPATIPTTMAVLLVVGSVGKKRVVMVTHQIGLIFMCITHINVNNILYLRILVVCSRLHLPDKYL